VRECRRGPLAPAGCFSEQWGFAPTGEGLYHIAVMLILFATPEHMEKARGLLATWGVVVEWVSDHPPLLRLQDGTFPRDRIRGLPGVVNVLPLSTPYPLAARGERSNTVFSVGEEKIGEGLTWIAGPCAVESREQVMETAQFLSRRGVRFLRGGAFKPRTSPYAFQGLGEEGLVLLREAADRFGMKVVSEVPDAAHVEMVAEYADILQVGARNMQNFPLLERLGEVDKPVLLKRGLGNTVEEWLLAAEYILRRGNSRVILCERGIRTFETALRFTLDVGAIAFARKATHVPVFVDPSHAAGRREFVIPLALAGVAAGAQGVVVEVHPRPEQALSDGPQALTFEDFAELQVRVEALQAALEPSSESLPSD